MNSKLKANLEGVIENFIIDNSDQVYWPDCIFGGNLAEHMANAAEAAFDCAVDASICTGKEE